VLFKRETLEQIAAGRVTLAFRRWTKPTVKAGVGLRTAAGLLAIDSVDKIAAKSIKEKDAKSAGHKSRAALMEELADGEGDLYRIAFRRIGDDPLIALRKEAKLTKKEMKSVIAALNRLDHASGTGAWTRTTLRLIDKYPARREPDDLQARGAQAEGARPGRGAGGRLPPLAARPRSARRDDRAHRLTCVNAAAPRIVHVTTRMPGSTAWPDR
jgi:hypothetical protein